jgi:hypothetical protein
MSTSIGLLAQPDLCAHQLAPLSKSGGSIELEVRRCSNHDLSFPFISLKIIQKSTFRRAYMPELSLDR